MPQAGFLIRLQDARLRALGIDATEATPSLVRALRPDILGLWLPVALADILSALLVSRGGRPPRLADIMASWGLPSLADASRESDTAAALDALGKL